MSLRLRVFLVVGSILSILFFIVDRSLSYFVTRDFSSLEQREVRENVVRVTDALQMRIEELSIKLSDWSQWDDTYGYVTDHNEQYRESNLKNETFGLLKLDFIVIIDDTGESVFKKYVRDGEEKPFLGSFENYLKQDKTEDLVYVRESHKGVIGLPEGVLIYAAQPITSSDGTAPAKGVIVFAYFFSPEKVQELGQLTHLVVQGKSFFDIQTGDSGFFEAKEHLSYEAPLFVEDPKSEDRISGYTALYDEDRRPVMFLQIETNRDTYRKGQESLGLFTGFMIVISIFFILIIFSILDQLVLKKVAYLSDKIKGVHTSGNLDTDIRLSGKDEFSHLAKEMSVMLKALHENSIHQHQHVEEIEKMNRMMINRELKMIELKKEIKRLQQIHE